MRTNAEAIAKNNILNDLLSINGAKTRQKKPREIYYKKDILTISPQIKRTSELTPIYNAIDSINGQKVNDVGKAVNNKLTFESNIPYRYKLDNGLLIYFYYTTSPAAASYFTDEICDSLEIDREILFTSVFNEETKEDWSKAMDFFSFLNDNCTNTFGMNQRFTQEEILSNFEALGVKPGWVEVHNNGNVGKFFLTADGTLKSEMVSEDTRKSVNSMDWSDVLSVGDEITCNGKPYKVDENGHINIPEGEPVYWGFTFILPGHEDFIDNRNKINYD